MRRVSVCMIALLIGTACLALPSDAAEWVPPLTRQQDFYSFWSCATYQTSLAQTPSPGTSDMLNLFAPRPAQTCEAQLQVNSNPELPMPVLHLTGRYTGGMRLQGLDGPVILQQRLGFEAVRGRAYALEGLPDIHACRLADAVTAARTALYTLLSHPHTQTARVGIIGEGVGASVGLALSVLEPDLIAFVACHEPLPAFHYLPDGTEADSAAVIESVRALPPRVRADKQVLRESLSYFDFYNFAPEVRHPTLISMSINDEAATPEQVLAIHNRLTCPKRLEVLDDPVHLGRSGRAEFYRRCADWIRDLGFGRRPVRDPGRSDERRGYDGYNDRVLPDPHSHLQ